MAARLLIVIVGSWLAVMLSNVFGTVGFVAGVVATAWMVTRDKGGQ